MKKNKFKPNKHKWWDEPQSIKTIKQESKNRLTDDPFRVSIDELVDCVSKQMPNELIFEKLIETLDNIEIGTINKYTDDLGGDLDAKVVKDNEKINQKIFDILASDNFTSDHIEASENEFQKVDGSKRIRMVFSDNQIITNRAIQQVVGGLLADNDVDAGCSGCGRDHKKNSVIFKHNLADIGDFDSIPCLAIIHPRNVAYLCGECKKLWKIYKNKELYDDEIKLFQDRADTLGRILINHVLKDISGNEITEWKKVKDKGIVVDFIIQDIKQSRVKHMYQEQFDKFFKE